MQVASHAQKYFIRLNSMNKKDKRRSSIHDITNPGGILGPFLLCHCTQPSSPEFLQILTLMDTCALSACCHVLSGQEALWSPQACMAGLRSCLRQ